MGNGFGRSFYFNYFRGAFQIGMIGGRLRGSTEVAAITPGSNKAQLILSDGEVVDLHAAVRQLPLSVIGIIRNDSLEGLNTRELSG